MLSQRLSGTGVLYHVTPASNAFSIDMNGIDPEKSTGKMKASWFVNRGNILWSVAHVSSRHHVAVDELVVCAVLVNWNDMRHMSRPGFYYTYIKYHVESISPAIFLVEQDK